MPLITTHHSSPLITHRRSPLTTAHHHSSLIAARRSPRRLRQVRRRLLDQDEAHVQEKAREKVNRTLRDPRDKAGGLSAAEAATFEAVFAKHDSDASGAIDDGELSQLLAEKT
jgi:hypothetical protein